MHQGSRVGYLVVRLDIELDLLSGECSDPIWTRNVSFWLSVRCFPVRVCDDAIWGGVLREVRNELDQHIETTVGFLEGWVVSARRQTEWLAMSLEVQLSMTVWREGVSPAGFWWGACGLIA